jgi:hypothetical protein
MLSVPFFPPPDSRFESRVLSLGTGEFLSHYINLQAPLQRSAIGFDSCDHVPDIVDPDGAWHWKHEDELIEAVQLGSSTRTRALKSTLKARASSAASFSAASHRLGELAA